jgi:hypothetical protein
MLAVLDPLVQNILHILPAGIGSDSAS